MALTDFVTADRPVQFPFASGFHAVVQWVAAGRAERARKAAMQSLLFAPEHRLRDLGISREQLLEAIETRRK
jgi:hypothetical protein